MGGLGKWLQILYLHDADGVPLKIRLRSLFLTLQGFPSEQRRRLQRHETRAKGATAPACSAIHEDGLVSSWKTVLVLAQEDGEFCVLKVKDNIVTT